MTEYLQIKIDYEAYTLALAFLLQEYEFMRSSPQMSPVCPKIERAIGAFTNAHPLNDNDQNTTR
jgi:hypothetical protein